MKIKIHPILIILLWILFYLPSYAKELGKTTIIENFNMWHYSSSQNKSGYWGGNLNKLLYDNQYDTGQYTNSTYLSDAAQWVAVSTIDLPEPVLQYISNGGDPNKITITVDTFKPYWLAAKPNLTRLMYRPSDGRVSGYEGDNLFTYEKDFTGKTIKIKFAPLLNFSFKKSLKKKGAPNYIPDVDNQYGFNAGSIFKYSGGDSLGGSHIYTQTPPSLYPSELHVSDIEAYTGELQGEDTYNLYTVNNTFWSKNEKVKRDDTKIGDDTFTRGGAIGICFIFPLEFTFSVEEEEIEPEKPVVEKPQPTPDKEVDIIQRPPISSLAKGSIYDNQIDDASSNKNFLFDVKQGIPTTE